MPKFALSDARARIVAPRREAPSAAQRNTDRYSPSAHDGE